ncbi:MAG: hypothetical protein LBW85_08570 [Deltaproteobacteria bacterium]|nr:hypothetical protein [Deltaproteobacteria bacterium]
MPDFAEMCSGFTQEAHAKYLAAVSCRDRVEAILQRSGKAGPEAPAGAGGGGRAEDGAGAGEGGEGSAGAADAPALTAFTSSLRECLAEAERIRSARERWLKELEAYRLEIENCAAALSRERASFPPREPEGGGPAGGRLRAGPGLDLDAGPAAALGPDGGRRALEDLDAAEDPYPEGGAPRGGSGSAGAGAGAGAGASRWSAALKSLSDRAASFERRHGELAQEALAASRRLKGALGSLIAAERRLAGERGLAARDGAEALAATVESLLAAALRSRGQLASFWRLSPSLVGRPAFLEKVFLSSAVNLGLAQGVLEETRHRLDGFTRRLSATRKIRREAEEFLSGGGGEREARERLWQADRALSLLKSAVAGLLDSERLRAEGARLRAEGGRLKRRLAEAEAALDRTEQEKIRAAEELARSEQDRAQAEEDLAQAEERRAQAEDGRRRLESDLGRSEESRARAERELGLAEEGRSRAQSALERAERQAELERLEADRAKEEHGRDLSRERGLREAAEREAEARVAAVAAERERLASELSDAQRRLAESGEAKAALVKLVGRAREALSRAGVERKGVQEELAALKRTLDPLRRRHRRLSELYGEGRRRLKALEAELREKAKEAEAASGELAGLREGELAAREAEIRRLEEERAADIAKLSGLSAEIARLEADREGLGQRQRELAARLEELKARETALALKLSGKEEELKEASSIRLQLGEIITQAQLHLDRVCRAHHALRASWKRRGAMLAQASLERDDLRIRLDRRSGELVEGATRLQEVKAELGEAAARRAELERERGELVEAVEEARRKALASGENEERLSRELELLKASAAAGAEGDLAPLVEILGIALWRSGLEIRKGEERAAADAEERRLEAGAREAGLRVAMAARELDHMEDVQERDRELEKAREENARLAAELAGRGAGAAVPGGAYAADDGGPSAGLQADEPLEITLADEEAPAGASAGAGEGMWLARELAAAFLTAEFRRARLKAKFAEFRRKAEDRRARDEGAKEELQGLLQERGRALEENRRRVAELVPLVEFFLEEGRSFWCGVPGSLKDTREALVFLLLEENHRLASEVESLASERQEAAASRRALTALTEAMKERLSTLRPLLEFLAAAFQDNTLALARAYAMRDGLAREASRFRGEGAGAIGPAGPEQVEGEAEAPAGAAGEEAGLEAAEADEADREIGRLQSESARLALENEHLSATAERQRGELAALRQESVRLQEDKERLSGELAAASGRALEAMEAAEAASKAAEEASRAFEELRRDPPPDGRVETAWAALNYLGTRAGDVVSRLEGHLNGQAREMEEAFAELQRRGERIKQLERRQDRLSLMYWIMLTLASRGLTLGLPEGGGALGLPVQAAGLPGPGGGSGDPGGGSGDQGGGSGDQGGGPEGTGGGPEGTGGGPDGTGGGAEGTGGGFGDRGGGSGGGDMGDLGSGGTAGAAPEAGSGEGLREAPGHDGPRPGIGSAAPAGLGLPGAEGGAPAGLAQPAPGARPSPAPPPPVPGGFLSKSFLKSLRDAAKKSLFSLVLSGGIAIAMAGRAGAEEAPAAPTAAPGPSTGPPALRRQLSFSPFHGVRGGPPSPPPAYAADPGRPIPIVATKMRSKTLGRTLDLGFLGPRGRALPEAEAEARAREALKAQAARMGLDLEAWVSLVRDSVPEGSTVYLDDLEGEEGAFRLLRPSLPGTAAALKAAGAAAAREIWALALQGSAAMRPGECQFWERLFGEFASAAGSPAEAALGLVFHLSRKNRLDLPVVEFVGVMSPVKEVEEMPHRRAVEFLSSHIRSARGRARAAGPDGAAARPWPSAAEAERLASDLYHASRIFRIPLTFLSSAILTDWARGGDWPGTMRVYTGALAVAGLVSRSARLWDPGALHICDLDELAPACLPASPCGEGLQREKAALARAALAAAAEDRASQAL